MEYLILSITYSFSYDKIFFLALPPKESKKSIPLKPIFPQKPIFSAIAQGLEIRLFWLFSNLRTGKPTGHLTL